MPEANTKRRGQLLDGAAVSALVLVVTGCAQTTVQAAPAPSSAASIPVELPAAAPGSAGLEEVPAFYREAAEDFPQPLPAGAVWPDSIPAGYTDAQGQYETDGLGKTIAATYWQCAWEDEFLEAFDNNEQARKTAALAMLEKRVTDLFFTGIYSDPGQGWKRDVLDPARRGDVSGMKSQHGNCPSAL